ncbi:MAG TPA: serine hydrolase domain-containing protein [Longimicrobium sp.]
MPPLALLAIPAAILLDTVRPPVLGPEIFRAADSIAAAEFAKDSLGSISVGIVSGPALVWTASYGFEDRARTRPATPATVYRVASLTKQLTAIMLLQLAEAGRLQLSDPAERWLPEIRRVRGRPPGSAPPTLVQLATMTSGLARDPDDGRRSQRGLPAEWERSLAAALPATSYAAPPGTRYRYSNIGYAILAAALARASGERYVPWVERHLLRPLGMSGSGFELTPALAGRLATGVDWDELLPDTLNYADAAEDHRTGLGFGVASGGLYSTVGDVAKLVAFELGFGPAGILRPETLAARETVPVAAAASLDYGYGLGFQAYRWGDVTAAGHSGNLAGYTAQVMYDTRRGFGVIVLRSAAGGQADAGRLAVRVFRRIRAALPE